MTDETLTFIVIYIVLALIPAAIAPSRGRTPINWFLVGILLSPLLALVGVVLLPSKKVAA